MSRATIVPAIAVIGALLEGCPGHLMNPDRFRDGAVDGRVVDAPAVRCTMPLNVETEIFERRCGVSNCHTAAARSGGLDLVTANVASRLVGRVASGCPTRILVTSDPATSYLIEKLYPTPRCGFQMPLSGANLTDEEIACVVAWVVDHNGSDASVGDAAMDATADANRDVPTADRPGDVPRTDAGSPPVFLEQAGAVTFEAENAMSNAPMGASRWERSTAHPGFSGTAAMLAAPNSAVLINTGFPTMSPRLRFTVDFQRTGTYYVWARGWGNSTDDDSIHVGIDNIESATSDRLTGFWLSTMANAWRWSSDTIDTVRATVQVTAAGVHTVDVWMREDGVEIDKLVLTTDMAFIPTGNGPAQSATGQPR